jgi:hypothetical protein
MEHPTLFPDFRNPQYTSEVKNGKVVEVAEFFDEVSEEEHPSSASVSTSTSVSVSVSAVEDTDTDALELEDASVSTETVELEEADALEETPEELEVGLKNLEKGDENLRPLITSAEMRSALSTSSEAKECTRCEEEVHEGEHLVIYEGRPYHEECLPFMHSDDLIRNPRISVNLGLRLSTLTSLIKRLPPDGALGEVRDHLSDVLCAQNTWFSRCSWCGAIVMKHSAQIGGSHTKKIKEESGITIGVLSGKFFSKAKSMEIFCSEVCDLNYSKKLYTAWLKKKEEDQSLKAAKSTERGVKTANPLRDLMKLSKTRGDVASKMQSILEQLGFELKDGKMVAKEAE